MQLKKRTDEAAQKVSTILKKSEEQIQLISSLQGTVCISVLKGEIWFCVSYGMFHIHDFQVGMYKRLYEEELKSRNGGLSQKETKIVTTTGIRFMQNAETVFGQA